MTLFYIVDIKRFDLVLDIFRLEFIKNLVDLEPKH